MKTLLLRLTAHAAALYLRHVPSDIGKSFLWERIVRRHLLWRRMSFIADTRFGRRMHAEFPDGIQQMVFFFGVWEPAVTQYISNRLQPGDVFIDIGANVGYDTLLGAACVGDRGKVYAIEASPSIHARLLRNLALNETSNVVACNVAVCDTPCEVPVFLYAEEGLGRTTIIESEAAQRDTTFETRVRGLPLADIVPEADLLRARLIKIDVEGAELLVLRGMARLLPRLAADTELVIEANAATLAAQGSSMEAFVDQFRSAGFRAFGLHNPYKPEFYFRRHDVPPPFPLVHFDHEQLDILFRR